MAANSKTANLWLAKLMPVLIVGILGYVSWVVVARVCVHYLLKPPTTLHAPRPAAAIAILVVYFFLLFFVASTYFRILQTVIINPGFYPRGLQWYTNRDAKTEAKGTRKTRVQSSKEDTTGEKANVGWGKHAREDGLANTTHGYAAAGSFTQGRPDREGEGLQSFYWCDAFVCESDGRPIWCSTCLNWKPDRAHHCREVDRCVRKMDHFCPWIGGVVSETNFKFFIQFVAWTAIFCTFLLITMAILVSESKKQNGNLSVHWILTLALAVLFDIFTLGLTASSIQFALLNTTTVENLSRKVKVTSLAVYLPRPIPNLATAPYQTITYPLSLDPLPQPLPPGPPPSSNALPRTYAILHTKQGESPWHYGSLENFKDVMGEHWYDWFVPLKYSPCYHQNHPRGPNPLSRGPVVQRLREEAGIAQWYDSQKGEPRRSRRHSRGHGEREKPDRSRRKRRRDHRGKRPLGRNELAGDGQDEGYQADTVPA